MHTAASMKRDDLLKLLYERLQLECEKSIPENEKDQNALIMDFMQLETLYGMTALHYAASKGSLKCVQFLVLVCQVPPSMSKNNQGHFPIHRAVMAGCEEALAQLLLLKDPLHPEKGINDTLLYSIDCEGNTLVHLAIDNGHELLSRYLVSLESNSPGKFLSAVNKAGQTVQELANSIKISLE
jgi:ankyrin repeat protein